MSLCVEKVCNSGFNSAIWSMPLIYMFKRLGHIVKRKRERGIAIVMNLNIGSHFQPVVYDELSTSDEIRGELRNRMQDMGVGGLEGESGERTCQLPLAEKICQDN